MTEPVAPASIEARYGPLKLLNVGMQSRVYVTPEGGAVIKVYRQNRGDHRREAANMRQAGLGERVIEVIEESGLEALVQQRFQGEMLTAQTIPSALPKLRQFFTRLHAPKRGEVNLQAVWARQREFREVLGHLPLDDLFAAVEQPLTAGGLAGPASFCHRDPWQGNILMDAQGEVLVIDWNKAGWDDAMRDIALLKSGTLDLLDNPQSLEAALDFVPNSADVPRLRAYLAQTYLHDFAWFLQHQPAEFETQYAFKLPRARYALEQLPAL